jgi:hypothetical protein
LPYTWDVPQPWVLLAYRLPREPSTPRIALWRRLRRLGAVQLLDGLVALPLGPETREQLEWLADEVADAGGEASIWIAEPGSAAEARALEQRVNAAVAAEYRAARAEAQGAHDRRTVARLRRTLRAIRARDYFGAEGREEAERAVDALAEQDAAAA